MKRKTVIYLGYHTDVEQLLRPLHWRRSRRPKSPVSGEKAVSHTRSGRKNQTTINEDESKRNNYDSRPRCSNISPSKYSLRPCVNKRTVNYSRKHFTARALTTIFFQTILVYQKPSNSPFFFIFF